MQPLCYRRDLFYSNPPEQGFTLIEMMMVVAVIGVLAAVAYPSYQNHIKKTKRVDMMTHMQTVAANIEAQKIASGSYAGITQTNVNYPATNPIYTYSISPASADWVITATPIAGKVMAGDGNLTLNAQGEKCHIISNNKSNCGDDWRN